ncbi:hypothetical protein [Nostoc sp.]
MAGVGSGRCVVGGGGASGWAASVGSVSVSCCRLVVGPSGPFFGVMKAIAQVSKRTEARQQFSDRSTQGS